MTNISTRVAVSSACGLFLLLGAALIPYGGVQNDEALFAAPLYEQNSKDFCISIRHHQVPLMVMTYVGTLKTALYIPILHFLGPNLWTVRLPMVLAGALTIFIFYQLLLDSGGRSAAALGAFLLASDPSFLLTDTFDWGPVALDHLLLVTGCLFVLRFARNKGSMPDLAAGFFFFGLALWNKALFLWALGGLACAAAVLFHREIRKLLRPRTAGVAAAAFLAGALPLVLYNIRRPNATLESNVHFDSPRLAMRKFPMLRGTLTGSRLFGFLTHSEWDAPLKTPESVRGRAAWWIRRHAGNHFENGFDYAFLFCLACARWWWRSRAAWFALIFLAFSWTAMALSHNAGNAVHHTVLLWPFPQLFFAIALAALPWRRFSTVAGVALLTMNLLVVNQYISELERNGASANFSDALSALAAAIPDPPKLDADHIYVVDWGMLNTLALFHQGRLPLFVGDPPFLDDPPSEDDRRDLDIMLNDRRGLFIGHSPAYEVNPVRERVEKYAGERGLRKEMVRTIYDSNGRAVFEIYRLAGRT